MIRVLHILNKLNRSGIESFIMNVYRNIDREKVQFDFLLVGEKAAYDDEVEALGGKIYRYINHGSRLKLISIYRKALKELSLKYDIVHIHAMSCKIFFVARYARKYGIKNVIVHCHGCGHKGILHRIMQKLLNRYTTIKVACSDVAGEALFGKNQKNNIIYFNNAIDTKAYAFDAIKRQQYRQDLGLFNELACVSVGRFSFEKNHSFMLAIFQNLLQQHKDAKLFLVGWGPEEDNIKKIIEKMSLDDNVIVLGARSDVPDLLNAMDVFLLPSLFEGLPVVAIEAQTNGIPVFLNDEITKTVAVTNLIHYLSIKIDAAVWANEILQNKHERKDMSYEVADRGFDIVAQANYIQEFYLSLK